MENKKQSYLKINNDYMDKIESLGLKDFEIVKLIRFILNCVYYYDKYESNKKYFGLVIDKETKQPLTQKQISEFLKVKSVDKTRKFLNRLIELKIIEQEKEKTFSSNKHLYKFLRKDLLPYFIDIEENKDEELKDEELKEDKNYYKQILLNFGFKEFDADLYTKDKTKFKYLYKIINYAKNAHLNGKIENVGGYIHKILIDRWEFLEYWDLSEKEYKRILEENSKQEDESLW